MGAPNKQVYPAPNKQGIKVTPKKDKETSASPPEINPSPVMSPKVIKVDSSGNKNVNAAASDFSEVAEWPTLVEVKQAQEAIQIHHCEKKEWRKSEERKLSPSRDDLKKNKKPLEVEADENNADEKGEDSGSGSHDDDSQKENREIRPMQTN